MYSEVITIMTGFKESMRVSKGEYMCSPHLSLPNSVVPEVLPHFATGTTLRKAAAEGATHLAGRDSGRFTPQV
jgi:hypothetical protein